jgi:hypothetical protein
MADQPIAYLDLTEANDLAAALPELAAWSAASDDDKTLALNQASLDVDSAMPYQGRPYDFFQSRQFPRVADDNGAGEPYFPAPADAVVWDWDATTNQAVVPVDVKRSVLYQADANLSGLREPRLAAQHDGVVYELTGTLAESYKQSTGPGVATGLCRRAWLLVRQYQLRSGRMV